MADVPTPRNAGGDSGANGGGVPTVASTITVPPSPPSEQPGGAEGGEWDLLVSKVRDWFASGQAATLWAQSRTPVVALAALVAVLMVLRVYGALIDAIDSIPLLPGLLELAGVIWLLRYGVPRLVRSSDRQHLVDGLRSRWDAFRGR
jgi:hypothetical protein